MTFFFSKCDHTHFCLGTAAIDLAVHRITHTPFRVGLYGDDLCIRLGMLQGSVLFNYTHATKQGSSRGNTYYLYSEGVHFESRLAHLQS
jgi:hypothetical protein